MEKMKRKTFYALSLGANVAVKAVSMYSAVFGVSAVGTILTTTAMGIDKKHPFIAGLMSGVSAGLVANTVVGSDSVGETLVAQGKRFAESVTDLVYGPSDEEEVTED